MLMKLNVLARMTAIFDIGLTWGVQRDFFAY